MWKAIFILILFNYIKIGNFLNIPANLIQCYRTNETQPWIGNTLQTLIELIRKIEDLNPTSIDIRRLSVNIVHRLRIDGIERAPNARESEFITPFNANGIMTPKLGLLLQLISDTPGPIEFSKLLSASELCLLHRFVSSAVEPFERGDERFVCPINSMSVDRWASYPWITQNKVQGLNGRTITSFSNRVSRCPLEGGTVRSQDYGTFSPGTFIASIAAGLQPQNVRIQDLISKTTRKYENLETMTQNDDRKAIENLLKSLESLDNTYAAGLAGDLAEVCVYQGPHMVGQNKLFNIGVTGVWNDTYFPRRRYLAENHAGRWEMTDAEILGGIDGMFLSQQIGLWVNKIRRLRLSQILDMYYSARGIPSLAIESVNRGKSLLQKAAQHHHNTNNELIDDDEKSENLNYETNTKFLEMLENPVWSLAVKSKKHIERFSVNDGISSACDRKNILQLIDRDKLKDETYLLSKILQFRVSSVAISDEDLKQNCNLAVDQFFHIAETLVETLPSCNDIMLDYLKPSVNLMLIIDGSRSLYGNLQFISNIIEMSDVSTFGSSISIIHGSSGELLVKKTKSVALTFELLRNYTGSFPVGLSLSDSLRTAHIALADQTLSEQKNGTIAGLSHVLIITSQDKRITTHDFESAYRMLYGSFLQFPDLYFVILTNNADTFKELTKDGQAGRIERQTHQYTIIETNSIDPASYTLEFLRYLKTIPKRIMAPYCEMTKDKNSIYFDDNRNGIGNYYEEYISPNQELKYRISPYYLKQTNDVKITFQGVSYGEITICMSRTIHSTSLQCKTIDGNDLAQFNVTNPCPNINECDSIYFSITMDKSLVRCTENDCRYPDQVRFIIRQEGLRCENDPRQPSSATPSNVIFGFNLSLALIIVIVKLCFM